MLLNPLLLNVCRMNVSVNRYLPNRTFVETFFKESSCLFVCVSLKTEKKENGIKTKHVWNDTSSSLEGVKQSNYDLPKQVRSKMVYQITPDLSASISNIDDNNLYKN
jgi:hypothetical protein